MSKTEFVIHIDNKVYKPEVSPLTGAQLRNLVEPPIPLDRDLFQVVPGPADDNKVELDEPIGLKNGMHFYTAPTTINPGSENDAV